MLCLYRWWNSRHGTYDGAIGQEEEFKRLFPREDGVMFPESVDNDEEIVQRRQFKFRTLSPEEEEEAEAIPQAARAAKVLEMKKRWSTNSDRPVSDDDD